MLSLTLKELSDGIKKKNFSSTEITKIFLTDIKKSNLNAFVSINEDFSLLLAKFADEKIANGEYKTLTGLPIAHKDIFVTKDFKSTACSKILSNYESPFDAKVVQNLNSVGMVNLGKLNCDEFAMGSSNENSFYGRVKNPWDYELVSGGSSGGSAAAVAGGLSPATTGTDTGGSIRQPASLCGVTGIKPTYGLISRYGMIAFASSLDQAGPIARTAEDCGLLLNEMVGYDERDSTSLNRPRENFLADLDTKINGLRIGVPKEYFSEGLDAKVEKTIQNALKEFEKMGATLIDISLPKTALSIPVYYVIAPAEAASNLSRFDGVRYGFRSKNFSDLNEMYCKTRSEGFGDEVKRRILIGSYVLSAGYYDAYYKKAQQVRRLIKKDFDEAFCVVDVIMTPTTRGPAFEMGSKGSDPIQMYLEDLFTISANLAGLPAMSLPNGNIENKPIGLQIIGNFLDESSILNFGHMYQTKTNWHMYTPDGVIE